MANLASFGNVLSFEIFKTDEGIFVPTVVFAKLMLGNNKINETIVERHMLYTRFTCLAPSYVGIYTTSFIVFSERNCYAYFS